MTQTRYWIDGRPATALHPATRAVHYGDGLFETLRVDAGRAVYFERHLRRLQEGCRRLRLDVADWPALAAQLHEHAAGIDEGVLKLVLSRAAGGRGYRFAPGQGVTSIVSLHPMPAYPVGYTTRGVRVRICELRLGLQPRLAGIKHLNRLEQVMARAEWGDDYEEGLLLDYNGHLIEGTMSNVFMARDNVLYTPRLDECGVAGVMRSVVLDAAEACGMDVRREVLSPEDLYAAQEVFLCNSVIGLWPVASVADAHRFAPGPVTQALQNALSLPQADDGGDWYGW